MSKRALKQIKKQLSRPAIAPPPLEASPKEQDKQLLQDAYQNVTPLVISDTYRHSPQRAASRPRQTFASQPGRSENPDMDWPEFTCHGEGFYRPGMRTDILKRMRRKNWEIQSELDLHGMTAEEALAATHRFICRCREAGFQRLRIIHGKGLNSPNHEPVLKKQIHQWLLHQPQVLAITHPNANQGGNGALLVMLRKAK